MLHLLECPLCGTDIQGFCVQPSSLEHSVLDGVKCVVGCLCCVVPLSRFRRLSGAGVVLTALALGRCLGMVSDGFQTQRREFVVPG